MAELIGKTWSVCPVCLKRLPAERIRIGDEVFIRKFCDEHGLFENIIWRGLSNIDEWVNDADAIFPDNLLCPDGCGLCSNHLQKTCCVILNVTNSCNLRCRFCFEDSNNGGDEPTFAGIRDSLLKLIEKGKTLVQLSGGEPTMRNDLPEIVKVAKEAGSKYVQLNTNGIRLGEDPQFVKRLAKAGLSFVFMQFDGTEDYIYENLRGKVLFKIKQKAIENCSMYNIGVTLVPTIVRDINTTNIGDILRFAIVMSPKVRGVHFQPVSYIGRIKENPSNSQRFTLDELVFEICRQTNGMIKPENLLPSACDHPLCGFHGDFMVDGNKLIPLSNRDNVAQKCSCNPVTAEKNRNFVGKRWLRPPIEESGENSCCGNIHDMDFFLKQIKTHGFTVTAMTFQDAGNIDFARLRNCSLHVYEDGKFIPFCAYYLTSWKL